MRCEERNGCGVFMVAEGRTASSRRVMVIPEMLVQRRRNRRRDHLLMSRIIKEYADDAFLFLSRRLSHFPILDVDEREFCSKGWSQLVRRQIYTHYRLAARCCTGGCWNVRKKKTPKETRVEIIWTSGCTEAKQDTENRSHNWISDSFGTVLIKVFPLLLSDGSSKHSNVFHWSTYVRH